MTNNEWWHPCCLLGCLGGGASTFLLIGTLWVHLLGAASDHQVSVVTSFLLISDSNSHVTPLLVTINNVFILVWSMSTYGRLFLVPQGYFYSKWISAFHCFIPVTVCVLPEASITRYGQLSNLEGKFITSSTILGLEAQNQDGSSEGSTWNVLRKLNVCLEKNIFQTTATCKLVTFPHGKAPFAIFLPLVGFLKPLTNRWHCW